MKASSAKKESLEALQQRSSAIVTKLKHFYPQANVALDSSTPLQLLIATILSAQCTDARVNLVTKDLFKKYRTVRDYATADPKELEQDIYSTGFYRAKARNIINCGRILVEEYGGKVPDTMDELLKLPGVGRKTANVVLIHAFGKTEGIVVDTHVKRVAGRLGFSKHDNPDKVEQDLMSLISKTDWLNIDNLLILHGRTICHARKPECPECPVLDACPSARLFMSKTN